MKNTVIYKKSNFHHHTFCVFEEVSSEAISAQKIDYESRSGSQYYFTTSGVFRVSTHWGRVADCRWILKSKFGYKNQTKKIGFASWESFYYNNDQMALFYVYYDTKTQNISIGHKDDKHYDGQALLRNAKNTQLAVQCIKDVLGNKGWIKHVRENHSQIISYIITDIIYKHLDTADVKKKYLTLSVL